MRAHGTLSVLPALLSAAAGNAIATNETGAIKWFSCDRDLGGIPAQCGTLTVPLDYSNESDPRTVDLDLIKLPAKTQPAPKGSILLNYGGPGQDGINQFLLYVNKQRLYIGEDHDMISWDPRATRRTLPGTCWNASDPAAATIAAFGVNWHDASNVSPYTNWAEGTVYADVCYEAMKEYGAFVGMASTSRDIMSIVDALDEDGLLRYWGVSGGTGLGATVAALFPDRMDKVILDGVMNSHEYYHTLYETQWFTSSDDTFKGIMDACAEVGPEKCPLARLDKSGEELVAVFDEFFEDLKTNPIPVSYPALGTGQLLDYSIVMNYVYTRIYLSRRYQYLVAALDALLQRDGNRVLEVVAADQADNPSLPSPDPVPAAAFAVMAIRCGDRIPHTDNIEDVLEALEGAHNLSPKFGYYGANLNGMLCAQWKFRAAERYEGDFQVKTKNPLLFIGNTYDPATPFVTAQNMSSGFQGSGLLRQDSYGHVTFLTQESNCTRDAVQAYFGEGVLPEKGTVCAPNLPLTSYVAGEFEGLDQVG